ncbi:MAG: helix-turn-helix domain-containing protein [Lachnospiraceae bacterium]|nr:helix-turn-helix domain-containing protein [Lachnospiraceae bacterium]
MFEYSTLQNLIELLEYRTKLHISVLFLSENCGSEKNILEIEHIVHSKPFCDFMKQQKNGLKRCMGCKQLAVRKAMQEKKPFSGSCINGIYEYCHPVVVNGEVLGIIFIGNVIRNQEQFWKKTSHYNKEKIRELTETIEAGGEEAAFAAMAQVVESYIRLMIEQCPLRERTKQFHPAVSMLLEFVEHYYADDVILKEVAKLYYFNEKYLGRLFKQQTGTSFREYLNTKRLECAAELLAQGKETVTKVAADSGFNNVTYFNRTFRRKYGVTPLEYRRLQRNH